MAGREHLHYDDVPSTLAILADLLDHRPNLPDGYELTEHGAARPPRPAASAKHAGTCPNLAPWLMRTEPTGTCSSPPPSAGRCGSTTSR